MRCRFCKQEIRKVKGSYFAEKEIFIYDNPVFEIHYPEDKDVHPILDSFSCPFCSSILGYDKDELMSNLLH
jgi:hypothetical protein